MKALYLHLWYLRGNPLTSWWECNKCGATAIDRTEREDADRTGCEL